MRNGKRWQKGLVGVAAVGALTFALSPPAGAAASHTLHGTMLVSAFVVAAPQGSCVSAPLPPNISNEDLAKRALECAQQPDTAKYFASTAKGAACVPDDGYEDIAQGAQVVVRDGSHKTIAVGRLGLGVNAADGGSSCTFTFSVKVPDASFYAISVSHRGSVSYSRSELARRRWTIALSL